ncbi:uncharacterized protein LOC130700717 [Daphnia carinata]|uniref:uncharacterized protein LOC130700717 n=1 Tax=Daphnia carinata TaxID=120202 RepID=UPI00257A0C50|nr:uncharacterized protein LOC130700717 [Daphnia carinata]
MATIKVTTEALETAKEKLKVFRARASKQEWKAFEIVGANKDVMVNFDSMHRFEARLHTVMESKVRLPCVVCQVSDGAVFCSITYTSLLNAKEKLSHSRFKPAFYFVVFPNETIFYSTKKVIPEVISDILVQVYGATQLKQLPLEGKDFRSLRQLHLNKQHKGKLCRRPVQDKHPIDFDIEMGGDSSSDEKEAKIKDEDKPWKKKKNEYYNQHFYPDEDPVITKFTVSSSSKFTGSGAMSKLHCDLKVTFRSENLINFLNYSMDSGILSYPLNPFLENVAKLGRTSVSIRDTEEN